jgi:hypothetical protein
MSDALLERLNIRICFDAAGGAGGVGGSSGSAGAGSAGAGSTGAGGTGTAGSTGSTGGASDGGDTGATGPSSAAADSFGGSMDSARADATANAGAGTPGATADKSAPEGMASMAAGREADRQSVDGYTSASATATGATTASAEDQARAEAAAADRAAELSAVSNTSNYAAAAQAGERADATRTAEAAAAARAGELSRAVDTMAAARAADRQSMPGYAADSPPAGPTPNDRVAGAFATVAGATNPADPTGFNPEINTELGGSFARTYDRANATIAGDPALNAAVKEAERMGVPDAQERVASIMAAMERNPAVGLEAVRQEVFSSRMAARSTFAMEPTFAFTAMSNAMDRVAELNPGLDVKQAINQAHLDIADLEQANVDAIRGVFTDPNLSFSEKFGKLDELGMTGPVLTAGMMGALSGIGRPTVNFGPAGKVGPAGTPSITTNLAADLARVQARAAEINAKLDPRAQSHRTSAVVQTADGKTIVAAGGRDLSPVQRSALKAEEIAAKAPGLHAEITALEHAIALGTAPQVISASRAFCDACAARITALGGRMVNDRTAVWDK